MTVGEILAGVRLPSELARLPVAGLDYDSRRIQSGYLFFAFPGAKADGRTFAEQAIEKGALAVVSASAAPAGLEERWIEVEHGRRALALAARRFYKAPDERLGLTGITGTNGKTTTAFLVDAVLRAAGKTTGLIGTIEYHLAGKVLPSVNTTPESLDLYRFLDELERAGGSHATLEVSSHALDLGRVHGMQFHTAVFTNLTRDHLDYHRTMEEYFAAKRMLFAGAPAPKFAVLNADDPHAWDIYPATETKVLWYGLDGGAGLRAVDISSTFEGLRFLVHTEEQTFSIESALVGRMNVYNILAACAVGMTYGIDVATIQRGIQGARSVPGRFERIEEGQPFLVAVDYAHTDDALRNAIAVARGLGPKRIITLFGCGGDRDRTKRPLMGMAAAEGSDYVVLTSDNPRSEDPLDIMNDAMVGLRRFDTPHVAEPNREKAIRHAIQQAEAGDIVILAGKGHEPYQVLAGGPVPFDDREVARKTLRGFGYHK